MCKDCGHEHYTLPCDVEKCHTCNLERPEDYKVEWEYRVNEAADKRWFMETYGFVKDEDDDDDDGTSSVAPSTAPTESSVGSQSIGRRRSKRGGKRHNKQKTPP